MPLVVPQFLQAKDLLTATVSPGTLGATGITWGTAVEMSVRATGTQTWKAFETRGTPSHEMFRPSDMVVANYHIEYDDFSMTVRELIPKNGAGALATIAASYDYIRVDYVWRPRYLATGAGTRLVVVGIRGDLTIGLNAGENVVELAVKPAGYGIYVGVSTDTPPI